MYVCIYIYIYKCWKISRRFASVVLDVMRIDTTQTYLPFPRFPSSYALLPYKMLYVRHVKWVHCHHGMARPHVADRGDGLQI
jgi:hypothetical protein